jgi:hypothetical protein
MGLCHNGGRFSYPPFLKEGQGGFYEHPQNPPQSPFNKGGVRNLNLFLITYLWIARSSLAMTNEDCDTVRADKKRAFPQVKAEMS